MPSPHRLGDSATTSGAPSKRGACVPIGGFINAIRPVALALPRIDAAATAAPIDQGSPTRTEPIDMGPIGGRVIDCAGYVHIEDASGFPLDDDNVLTVS